MLPFVDRDAESRVWVSVRCIWKHLPLSLEHYYCESWQFSMGECIAIATCPRVCAALLNGHSVVPTKQKKEALPNIVARLRTRARARCGSAHAHWLHDYTLSPPVSWRTDYTIPNGVEWRPLPHAPSPHLVVWWLDTQGKMNTHGARINVIN